MNGGPVKYTREMAEEFCMRLVLGASVHALCREPEMPSERVIAKWRTKRPEFRDMYDAAVKERAYHHVEEILEIADDKSDDWLEVDGKKVFDREHVNRSRLRVEARKWAASKFLPRVFGDKQQVEHTGSLTVTAQDLTDDELANIAASGSK